MVQVDSEIHGLFLYTFRAIAALFDPMIQKTRICSGD